jgi:hypothetical protein
MGNVTIPVSQQMRIMGLVWGRKALVPGSTRYVGLGFMDPDKPVHTSAGKRRFNGQTSFVWPDEKEKVQQFLTEHRDHELFFTPGQFSSRTRSNEDAEAERCLWADLDNADPRKGVLRRWEPTIAWETSPGSYQAVWVLQDAHDSARKLSTAGGLNQRLNYAVGADKGGWASNKYLRVPGSINAKPERMAANGGNPVRGNVLWFDRREWLIEEFDDLPAISTQDLELIDHATEDVIDSVNRTEVWNRVRMRVSQLTREYMAVRTETQAAEIGSTQPEGRSGIVWQIERDLADAGCNAVEIAALIRRSVWNKFAGRSNEITQLMREASKAIAEKSDDALEVLDDKPMETSAIWVSALQLEPMLRPKWIVKNIWQEGACGFLSGVPKSYKSFFAVDLSVSISTGTEFLGEFATKEAPVLFIEEEDSKPLAMDRYGRVVDARAPYANAKGMLSYNRRDGVIWTPQQKQPQLAMHIHQGFVSSESRWHDWLDRMIETYGFRFVVIDTMGTTLGVVDSYKSDEVNAKVLRPLKQISEKHNCAIGIVHHNRKAATANEGGGRHGQDMMGTTAFHAWVESSMYFIDKVDRLGKPSEVTIYRESKMDTELKFKVQIPYMSDEDPLWRPRVNLSSMDEVGIEQAQREVEQQRTGGYAIAQIIKGIGGSRGRLVTLHDIVERTQKSEQTTRAQLDKAVKNGFLIGDPSTGWTLKEGQ